MGIAHPPSRSCSLLGSLLLSLAPMSFASVPISIHQPILVTYACPGIWCPSLPTTYLSRVAIYPISHSELEDLKEAHSFHEDNYLCAQIIVHIIG